MEKVVETESSNGGLIAVIVTTMILLFLAVAVALYFFFYLRKNKRKIQTLEVERADWVSNKKINKKDLVCSTESNILLVSNRRKK